MTRLLSIVLAALALTAAARGQTTETPTTRPGGLLAGPTVPDTERRTLITTIGDGRLVMLDERPEVAALGLALIDPERRAAARSLVTERRTALGMLLVDRIDVVRDATDAMRAGDDAEARRSYLALQEEFERHPGRAPLLHDFAAVLAPEELKEVRSLVDEYWAEWLPRSARNAGLDAEDPAALATHEEQLRFQLFQKEIGEAYQWSLRPFQAKLEVLYEITSATPEQRAALRSAIIDHVRDARLDPTPEQRRATGDRIYEVLDDEQRRRLFDHALWRL